MSPLGCVGLFVLGGVFSAQFGMAAVFGTEAGLSVGQISIFVTSIYVGGLLLQFPIGWISDRVERRTLILVVTAVAAAASALPVLWRENFEVLVLTGFVIGGMTNPLYALLIAYVNDYRAAGRGHQRFRRHFALGVDSGRGYGAGDLYRGRRGSGRKYNSLGARVVKSLQRLDTFVGLQWR